MIFGKSSAQKRLERYNAVDEILKNGFKRFAWRPVKLHDGKYIFLEFYQAYIVISERYDMAKSKMPLWTIKYNYLTENYTIADAVVRKLIGEGQKEQY